MLRNYCMFLPISSTQHRERTSNEENKLSKMPPFTTYTLTNFKESSLVFVLIRLYVSHWKFLLCKSGWFYKPSNNLQAAQFLTDHTFVTLLNWERPPSPNLPQSSASQARVDQLKLVLYMKDTSSPLFQPLLPLLKHFFSTEKTTIRQLSSSLHIYHKGCRDSSEYHFHTVRSTRMIPLQVSS